MDESIALHVVAPPGAGRERIVNALSGLESAAGPVFHDGIDGFRNAARGERCAVIVDVDEGVDCHELLRVCDEVADEGREWVVLIPEDGDGETFSLRPVSSGFSLDPDEAAPLLAGEREDAMLFELHEVLRFVARIRHDINNPLTAGLAETQLLLMDLDDEDPAGEALETIQRQLERIQALVKEMTRLRRPDREVA